MYLLAAQHSISCAQMVLKIWYFAWNLRAPVLGRNDMVWITRVSLILSEAKTIIPMYLRKVMKHSSSNRCISLQYSIPFPVLGGCPKSEILCEIWELFLAYMTPCGPWWACRCYRKLVQSSIYIWGRLWNSLAAMDVSPCSTVLHILYLEGTWSLAFCLKFESYFDRNDMVWTIRVL